jgi:hypothetical protein
MDDTAVGSFSIADGDVEMRDDTLQALERSGYTADGASDKSQI